MPRRFYQRSPNFLIDYSPPKNLSVLVEAPAVLHPSPVPRMENLCPVVTCKNHTFFIGKIIFTKFHLLKLFDAIIADIMKTHRTGITGKFIPFFGIILHTPKLFRG
jgi:hypothetical protein